MRFIVRAAPPEIDSAWLPDPDDPDAIIIYLSDDLDEVARQRLIQQAKREAEERRHPAVPIIVPAWGAHRAAWHAAGVAAAGAAAVAVATGTVPGGTPPPGRGQIGAINRNPPAAVAPATPRPTRPGPDRPSGAPTRAPQPQAASPGSQPTATPGILGRSLVPRHPLRALRSGHPIRTVLTSAGRPRDLLATGLDTVHGLVPPLALRRSPSPILPRVLPSPHGDP